MRSLLFSSIVLSLVPLTLPASAAPALESPMILELSDGRSLAWRELGPPDGRAVFFFHGGADSGLAAQLLAGAAEAGGVRLIAPDRPGFGASSPDPGRSLVSWADDVAALADHLCVGSFDVLGHSGGGPHALAVAARLPQRVGRVVVVAGGAPKDAGAAGMALPFRLNRWFAITAPGMQRRFLQSHRSGLENPQKFLSQWGRMSTADGAMFSEQPEVGSLIVAEMTEAYRAGIDGAALEGQLYYQDWGFSLDSVEQPVDLFYGDADPMAPLSWGRYFVERLPSGTLHVLENEGHFSGLVHHATAILEGRSGP